MSGVSTMRLAEISCLVSIECDWLKFYIWCQYNVTVPRLHVWCLSHDVLHFGSTVYGVNLKVYIHAFKQKKGYPDTEAC